MFLSNTSKLKRKSIVKIYIIENFKEGNHIEKKYGISFFSVFKIRASFFFFVLLLLLLFLGPLPRHMEVPRLGVESEL